MSVAPRPRPAARCPPPASRRRISPVPWPAIRRRSVGRPDRARGRRRPAAMPHRPGARSAPRSQPRAARMASSVATSAVAPSLSRLAVGSSRTSSPGRGARAPASARRCCWPPDRRRVRSRSVPARPTSASAWGTRACIASRSQPRFSRPNATSSSTRSITSCVDGSWSTRPTLAATPTGPRARASSSSRCSVPSTVAGIWPGISPAIASASVLLPDPDGPTMRRTDPGSRSRSTPANAGPSAPG